MKQIKDYQQENYGILPELPQKPEEPINQIPQQNKQFNFLSFLGILLVLILMVFCGYIIYKTWNNETLIPSFICSTNVTIPECPIIPQCPACSNSCNCPANVCPINTLKIIHVNGSVEE